MFLYVWKWVNQQGKYIKDTVIDNATSIIWERECWKAGYFELYIRATRELMDLFHNHTTLITRPDRREAMMPEKVQLTTDAENGDYLTISGSSAEIMLSYRIFVRQWYYQNWYAESMIRDMLTTQLITPDDLARKNPLIELGENHGWYERASAQVTGNNLLSVISDVCESLQWGFYLAWDDSTGRFTFDMYKGADHSGGSLLPAVVFSPEYGNIANTTYTRDHSTYYNSVYAGGEGEGFDRIIENSRTGPGGIWLRELWIDSRNTSSTTEGGTLTPTEYANLLEAEAAEEIELHKDTITYSGEIIDTEMYTYGVDYNLGDKVAVVNEYGIRGTAIVSAITEVEDETGYRIYPTLTEWSVD